ncbi:MAG: WD40/YVTN/BNR-like repeat-containing protein [Polyangiaceae bacterium]
MRAPVIAVALITLGLLYTPREARANGRFPKAQAIVLPAHGDGSTIYLRATFGVLVSRDAGKSWRWLCERALGFSSTWDPPLAATRDGRLWVALTDGVHATFDGCAIDDVPALKGELVADLAVDGTGDRVFAVSSSPGKPAFVWRSQGGASALRTFTRLGKGISGFRFDTIEVAPSNPSRVYLTALLEGKGPYAHIFRSDDGGATLTELSPGLKADARLFIAAVDPRDADRIYVRALSAAGSDVLLSTDGGKSFSTPLHLKGAMFGFARTAEGNVLYAGSGDPSEGIWRSTDRGVTWEPRAKTSVFCLNADGPRLLVCSNPYTPGGYAVAQSSDQGATVNPLATFDDVLGPVECAGAAPGRPTADAAEESPCAASWPETRAAIATSARARPPTLDAAPPRDASDDRGGGDAPDAGAAAPRAPACGCRIAGVASSGGGGGALFAALAALARRLRRARELRREERTLDRV